MFRLESYVTPILSAYLNKYIKNLKPDAVQLSIWSGEARFTQLDLRLDALAYDFDLPFEIISGSLLELRLRIPWAKLGSESALIIIDGLELQVRMRKADLDRRDAYKTVDGKRERHVSNDMVGESNAVGRPAPGYLAALLHKVILNMKIEINHLIIKYIISDDVQFSITVKSMLINPVNAKWEESFINLTKNEPILRRNLTIKDMNICLHRGNSTFNEEPIVSKCSFTCRNESVFSDVTHFHIHSNKLHAFIENLLIYINTEQLPHLLRVYEELLAFASGYIPTARKLLDSTVIPHLLVNKTEQPQVSNQQGWSDWAWGLVGFTDEDGNKVTLDEDIVTQMEEDDAFTAVDREYGIYCKNVAISFSVRNKEWEEGTKKFKTVIHPFMKFNMEGLAVNAHWHADEYLNASVRISSLEGNLISFYNQNFPTPFLNFIKTASDEESIHFLKFLHGSLFSNQLTSRELNENMPLAYTSLTEHVNIYDEEYFRQLNCAIAMDYVKMTAPNDMNDSNETFCEDALLRCFAASCNFHIDECLMHRWATLLEIFYTEYPYEPIVPPAEETEIATVPLHIAEETLLHLLREKCKMRLFNCIAENLYLTIVCTGSENSDDATRPRGIDIFYKDDVARTANSSEVAAILVFVPRFEAANSQALEMEKVVETLISLPPNRVSSELRNLFYRHYSFKISQATVSSTIFSYNADHKYYGRARALTREPVNMVLRNSHVVYPKNWTLFEDSCISESSIGLESGELYGVGEELLASWNSLCLSLWPKMLVEEDFVLSGFKSLFQDKYDQPSSTFHLNIRELVYSNKKFRNASSSINLSYKSAMLFIINDDGNEVEIMNCKDSKVEGENDLFYTTTIDSTLDGTNRSTCSVMNLNKPINVTLFPEYLKSCFHFIEKSKFWSIKDALSGGKSDLIKTCLNLDIIYAGIRVNIYQNCGSENSSVLLLPASSVSYQCAGISQCLRFLFTKSAFYTNYSGRKPVVGPCCGSLDLELHSLKENTMSKSTVVCNLVVLPVAVGLSDINSIIELCKVYKNALYQIYTKKQSISQTNCNELRSASAQSRLSDNLSPPLEYGIISKDDIRSMSWKYLHYGFKDGEDLLSTVPLPKPGEMVFHRAPNTQSMIWCYQFPRSITMLRSLPVPLSSRITHEKLACSLEYYDELKEEFRLFKMLSISESKEFIVNESEMFDEQCSNVPASHIYRISVQKKFQPESGDTDHSTFSILSLGGSLIVDSICNHLTVPKIQVKFAFQRTKITLMHENYDIARRRNCQWLKKFSIMPGKAVLPSIDICAIELDETEFMAKSFTSHKGWMFSGEMSSRARIYVTELDYLTKQTFLEPVCVNCNVNVVSDQCLDAKLRLDLRNHATMFISPSILHSVSYAIATLLEAISYEHIPNHNLIIGSHFIFCNGLKETLFLRQHKESFVKHVLPNTAIPWYWSSKSPSQIEFSSSEEFDSWSLPVNCYDENSYEVINKSSEKCFAALHISKLNNIQMQAIILPTTAVFNLTSYELSFKSGIEQVSVAVNEYSALHEFSQNFELFVGCCNDFGVMQWSGEIGFTRGKTKRCMASIRMEPMDVNFFITCVCSGQMEIILVTPLIAVKNCLPWPIYANCVSQMKERSQLGASICLEKSNHQYEIPFLNMPNAAKQALTFSLNSPNAEYLTTSTIEISNVIEKELQNEIKDAEKPSFSKLMKYCAKSCLKKAEIVRLNENPTSTQPDLIPDRESYLNMKLTTTYSVDKFGTIEVHVQPLGIVAHNQLNISIDLVNIDEVSSKGETSETVFSVDGESCKTLPQTLVGFFAIRVKSCVNYVSSVKPFQICPLKEARYDGIDCSDVGYLPLGGTVQGVLLNWEDESDTVNVRFIVLKLLRKQGILCMEIRNKFTISSSVELPENISFSLFAWANGSRLPDWRTCVEYGVTEKVVKQPRVVNSWVCPKKIIEDIPTKAWKSLDFIPTLVPIYSDSSVLIGPTRLDLRMENPCAFRRFLLYLDTSDNSTDMSLESFQPPLYSCLIVPKDACLHVIIQPEPVCDLIVYNACPYDIILGESLFTLQKVINNEGVLVAEEKEFNRSPPKVPSGCTLYYSFPSRAQEVASSSESGESHGQCKFLRIGREIKTLQRPISVWSEIETLVNEASLENDKFVAIPGVCYLKVRFEKESAFTYRMRVDPMSKIELPTKNKVKKRNTFDVEVANETLSVASESSFMRSLGTMKREGFLHNTNFVSDINVSSFSLCFMRDSGKQRKKRVEEILRLSLRRLKIQSYLSDSGLELAVNVYDFQIDNQLYEKNAYDYPVVLCRDSFGSDGTEQQALINCLVNLEISGDAPTIRKINVNLAPFELYLEDSYLLELLKSVDDFIVPAIVGYVGSWFLSKWNIPVEANVNGDVFLQTQLEGDVSKNQLIRLQSLQIQPVYIKLSVHASMGMFIAVNSSPLSFSQLQLKECVTTREKLLSTITLHYARSTLLSAGMVVGSADILGNPVNLLRHLARGVNEFFLLPCKSIHAGPVSFVNAVAKGASSFMSNVSTGTLSSVTNMFDSLSRNLDALSYDNEHIERQNEMRRTNKPQHLLVGLQQGLSGLGFSVLGAIAGLVDQPIRATIETTDDNNLLKQFIFGLGKGILGALAKPLAGASTLMAQTGAGILHGMQTRAEKRFKALDLEYSNCVSCDLGVYVMLSTLLHEAGDALFVSTGKVSFSPDPESCVKVVVLLTKKVLFLIEEATQQVLEAYAISHLLVKMVPFEKPATSEREQIAVISLSKVFGSETHAIPAITGSESKSKRIITLEWNEARMLHDIIVLNQEELL